MPRLRPYQSEISSQQVVPGASADVSTFGGPATQRLGQAVEEVGVQAGQIQRIVQENEMRQQVTQADMALSDLDAKMRAKIVEDHRKWKKGDAYLSDVMPLVLKQEIDTLYYNEDGSNRYTYQPSDARFQHKARAMTAQIVDLSRQADADLAGKTAVQEQRAFIDNQANFLQTHPYRQYGEPYYMTKAAEADRMYDDPAGIYARFPTAVREGFKREAHERFAIANVEGMIRENPLGTLQRLTHLPTEENPEYGWMATQIPDQKMPELILRAQREVDAVDADRRRAIAEARQVKKDHYDSTDQALAAQDEASRAGATGPDGRPIPPVTHLQLAHAMAADDLDGATGRAWIAMLKAREGEHEPKTDLPTYWRLHERILLPAGDPDRLTTSAEIYRVAGGDPERGVPSKLSPTDAERLYKLFMESRTPEGERIGHLKQQFLDGVKHSVTHSVPMLYKFDEKGDLNFMKLSYQVDRAVEVERAAGRDPSELFNPDSPKYLGPLVEPLKRTQKDIIEDISRGLRRGKPSPPQQAPVPQSAPDTSNFGNRTDGTQKGLGYFGVLKRPDGKVSTELSTDDPIEPGGPKVLHPLIVPSLTKPELDYLLTDRKDNKVMEERIYDKAAAHARERIKAGKSPFAEKGEQMPPPSTAPAKPPRKPGETPEQYLNRIGK